MAALGNSSVVAYSIIFFSHQASIFFYYYYFNIADWKPGHFSKLKIIPRRLFQALQMEHVWGKDNVW